MNQPVTIPTRTLAAIRQRIEARIARVIEERTQAARAALKSEDAWYFNRQQLPPPEHLEGK
jgi:hypothetical protein